MKSLSEGQIRELLLTAKQLAYDEGYSIGFDEGHVSNQEVSRIPDESTVKEWNEEIDHILKEI